MAKASELGIPLDGEPGPYNAITDIPDLKVGHSTIISGEGQLVVGEGPVRTGLTAILPRGHHYDPVFAGIFALNGNGEMTGSHWVEESGFMEHPVLITNTHAVGVTHDALIAWVGKNKFYEPLPGGSYWVLPVVAETYDGFLNDVNGFHVKPEHVFEALDTAASGPVAQGNVGGGTGMMCHQFKGGIGTSSRVITGLPETYTVGVLVQANYGLRRNLTIASVPVGKEITDLMPEIGQPSPISDTGSIIVIIATDAPLLPYQLKRMARRAALGLGRLGGFAANGSGDIILAFSTANPNAAHRDREAVIRMIPNDFSDPLLEGVVQATEEAVINALLSAETMSGINGNTVYALPHDRLIDLLKKYGKYRAPV